MNDNILAKLHDGRCDKIVEHERRLGALEKGVEVLELQASTLFKQAKDAFDEASSVGRKVDKVQYSLENGISRDIKELCELSRKQHDVIERNRQERETQLKELSDRIAPLEETSWIPKLVNMGVKKAFFWLLVLLFCMAMAQTAMWGVTKTFMFKEAPGQSVAQFHTLDKGHPQNNVIPENHVHVK